jgi:serine incorporator 1/3
MISCGVSPTVAALLYFSGFVVTTIVSWVLRDYGGDALDFGPADGCTDDGSCGDLAVLRISFGSVIFFTVHLLLTLGVTTPDNPRYIVHAGHWPIKFLLWGGLIASCFAMPNSVFDVYEDIARVLSVFFIVIQLVILLEFIYGMNEYLLERDDRCSAFTLVAASATLIAGSIVGMGFLYKYWAPQASCSLNIFFITWTLIMFLAYGIISVSPARNESAGALLCSGMSFCRINNLLQLALMSSGRS